MRKFLALVTLAFAAEAGLLPPPPQPTAGLVGLVGLGRRHRNVSESQLPQGVRAGCQGGVTGYPSDWPNSFYYQRMCRSAFGLAVVTDGIAPDNAMDRTAWTIDNIMSTVHTAVTQAMINSGFRQALMGRYPYETVTSLPEYSNLDPNFWNTRRGCGATDSSPVGCNAEEDVLCYQDDLYPDMDITVHEFGHSLHWLGFNHVWPQFQQELDACYQNAKSNNLWGSGYVGSYSMTNSDEYFANGLMTYFDVQYPYDQGAPSTRTELYQMDPQFASLLDRYMGQNPWRGGCP